MAKKHLKDFFIPHEENNYHPHILHTKRAVLYSAVFLTTKIIVVIFALLVPTQVFLLPDILSEQRNRLLILTNELRQRQGIPILNQAEKLFLSTTFKVYDMVEKSYFSHVNLENQGLAYFLSQANYNYTTAGENLAVGFSEAEQLFAAWEKSPTHYANLIDQEFQEFDLNLKGGTYSDYPVIYVAQHFGRPSVATTQITNSNSIQPQPKFESQSSFGTLSPSPASSTAIAPTSASFTSPSIPPTTTPEIQTSLPEPKLESQLASSTIETPLTQVLITTTSASVKSEKQIKPEIKKQPEPSFSIIPSTTTTILPEKKLLLTTEKPIIPQIPKLNIDKKSSFVSWQDLDKNTKLSAQVNITGEVKSASVQIFNYTIPLSQIANSQLFTGAITIPESSTDLFQVVLSPTLVVNGLDGKTFNETIEWESVKIVSPTPIEKYTRSRDYLSPLTSLFTVSKNIYLGFALFFIVALILNIFIEIRRQHYHIIAQTLGVIVLLLSLSVV